MGPLSWAPLKSRKLAHMALLGQFLEQPSIRKYICTHMYFLPACNHLSVLDKLLTQCLAV